MVNTTVLNTKNSKVENKIPNSSSLVNIIVSNTKISEVEKKSLIILDILLLKNLIS